MFREAFERRLFYEVQTAIDDGRLTKKEIVNILEDAIATIERGHARAYLKYLRRNEEG